MALKRRNRVEATFAMSSMTDLIFLLLLFFVMASTMSSPNDIKINLPQSRAKQVTRPQVAKVSIDNLYFIATGGGVCFGGGEPLLRVDFITEFKQLCGKSWNLTAETSLQVPRASVEKASEVIGDFIVDIKEGNPDTYRAYTGGDAIRAWDNLALLLLLVGPEHITVRVPLIPDFNDESDTDRTTQRLADMGVTRIDRFTYRVQ